MISDMHNETQIENGLYQNNCIKSNIHITDKLTTKEL